MDNRPIGIFDSGIGGLTVTREIYQVLPHESTIYVGDTARVPYGNRSREMVIHFCRQIVNFLLTQDVKAVVIACSTATSQALPALTKEYSIPIYGVVEPAALEALVHCKNHSLAVIGTRGTINSGAFQTIIKANSPQTIVHTQICPLFVPLAEEGMVNGDIVRQIASHYLTPLKQYQPDTLILGCTHYPLLTPLIQEVMGKSVTLINPGKPLANHLHHQLTQLHLTATHNSHPTHHFYITDNPPQFQNLATRFLGKKLMSIPTLINFD